MIVARHLGQPRQDADCVQAVTILQPGGTGRRVLLIDEIRSAKIVRVGSGSLTDFSEADVDSEQQGSAIQIFPSTNTSEWIRYYWDSSDQKLKRTEDGLSSYLV